jgi:DNA-directed RNA polymerase beta' subunit
MDSFLPKSNNDGRRFLNSEEIENIVETFEDQVIFRTYGIKDIKEKSVRMLGDNFEKQLKNIRFKINNLEDNLNDLVSQMVEKYIDSIMIVGKPVGVIAAQSIGEKATQSTLNTFHSAGVSSGRGVTSMLDRLIEVLQGNKKIKAPTSYIHIQDMSSLEEVKVARRKIQYTLLENLIEDITYDDVVEEFFDMFTKMNLGSDRMLRKYGKHMTITLNKEKIYNMRLSPKFIAESIEKTDGKLKVIYTPLFIGKLYVFVTEPDMIELTDEEYAFVNNDNKEYHFFSKVVKPAIEGITFDGIPNLFEMFLSSVNLGNVIQTISKTKQGFVIGFNKSIMRLSSITLEDMKEFIYYRISNNYKSLDMDIRDDKIIINTTDKIEDSDISKYIAEKHKISMRDAILRIEINDNIISIILDDTKIKNLQLDLIYVLRIMIARKMNVRLLDNIFIIKDYDKEDIMKDDSIMDIMMISGIDISKSKKWYVEADNINLMETLSHHLVDASTTITTSITETYEVLGIEAARSLILHELIKQIQGINMVHLKLVSDTMTYMGYITSMQKIGHIKQKLSVTASIGFETSTQTAFDEASVGKTDDLNGVSGNIIVGTLADIGSESRTFDLLNEDTMEIA